MKLLKPCLSWICVVLIGNWSDVTRAFSLKELEEDSPTCDELRAFWDIVSRTVRLSQITNEIPVIPLEVFTDMLHPNKLRVDNSNRIKPEKYERNNLMNMFEMDPHQPFSTLNNIYPRIPLQSVPAFTHRGNPHHPVSNDIMAGSFGEFRPTFEEVPSTSLTATWLPEPGISAFSPLETKNAEEVYVPKWGSPEEVGMFGEFLDLDERSTGHTQMRRIPKEPTGKWAAFSELESTDGETSCAHLSNRECSSDAQCNCNSWPNYRCMHGRCTLEKHFKNGYTNRYGTWHNGPLPSSKLGVFSRLRKRDIRPIYM